MPDEKWRWGSKSPADGSSTPAERARRGFGDKHHAALLADNWKYDGVDYTKSFSDNQDPTFGAGEALQLSAKKASSNVQATREGDWDLLIHVLDVDEGTYSWVRVCSYKNFIYAAAAVTGNF